jgi:hypothetical protein
MAAISARNLTYESALQTTDFLTCIRNRRLANEAWRQAQTADPGHTYSKDYARGFQDGFATDLETGECGTTPSLPAKPCWLVHNGTPREHEAIRDWFTGFSHGVAAARDGSARPSGCVPSAAPGPGILPAPPQSGLTVISPPPPPNGLSPYLVVEPVLPFPRPVPPAPGGTGPAGRPPAAGEGSGVSGPGERVGGR